MQYQHVPPFEAQPQPLITRRVSADDIRETISLIVTQDEPPAQMDRLRHLQEELIRLTIKRDRIDALRNTFGLDSFGREAPTQAQIAELYELAQTFYQGFYAAMSALLAFVKHFTSWQVVEQSDPPGRSVERFIKWLEKNVRGVDAAITLELRRAREMRTLFDHPDQRRFDWGSTHDPVGLVVLYLFGDKGASGAEPEFAQHLDGAPGDWQVLAQSEVSVTNTVANVLYAIAHDSHIRVYKTEEEARAFVGLGVEDDWPDDGGIAPSTRASGEDEA